MNMKKSIAGVMAGALAVSAIATTASAWTGGDADQTQIVLSYDLNKEGHAWNAGSATLKFAYQASDNGYEVTGLRTSASTGVKFGAKIKNLTSGFYTLDTVTVSGVGFKQADGQAENSQRIFGRKAVIGTDGKNETLIASVWGTDKDGKGNICAFTVPFTTGNNNIGFSMDRFKLDQEEADDTWTVEAKVVIGVKTGSAAVVNQYITDATGTTMGAKPAQGAGKAAGVFTLAEAYALEAQFKADGYTVAVELPDGADGSVDEHVIKLNKAQVPDKYETEKVTFTYNNETDATNKKLEILANQANATPAAAEIGKFDGAATVTAPTEATATGTKYGFKQYDVTLQYSINYADNIKEYAKGSWELGWAVEPVMDGITDMAYADAWGNIQNCIYSANFVSPTYGTYYSPMRTNWNAPAEVVSRLKDLGYTYPQAVLNDVIANNENVAFTFTTAQKYVDNREYIKVDGDYTTFDNVNADHFAIVENPMGGRSLITYDKAVYRRGNDVYIENPYYGVAYDGNKTNDFTDTENALWYNPVFSQALYQKFTWNGNGYTASGPNGSQGSKDQFGSYASIWNTNLNSAGLVANSMWTMQLSDVDAFEWGDSTITFFWNAITDEANITNAANFLQTLQLYTPSEWFWDKLDVAVGAAIAEDVSADATLDETPEEVVDEDPAEELIEDTDDEDEDFGDFEDEDFGDFEDEDEDFTFDEPEDEPEDEPAPAVEEAPAVVEVESPKTGNAPVALAVIPVALAAAAVVAKKRK